MSNSCHVNLNGMRFVQYRSYRIVRTIHTYPSFLRTHSTARFLLLRDEERLQLLLLYELVLSTQNATQTENA